jgi:hypothetical protein
MRKLIAAATLLSLVVPNASAAGWDWLTQYKKPNLHWGQLELHPHYRFVELYDSNIYLVPKPNNGISVGRGVRGSFIHRNILGLETALPIGALHRLTAGYEAQIDKYSYEPRTNDTVNQRAHLDWEYRGAYGVTVRAGDEYVNTNDQAFSQLIERETRWYNRAHVAADYRPENGRLAGGVDASHTTNKYVGPTLGRLLNRYTTRAGFNVGYMVQPKTKAYAAYHRGVTHYTVHRELPNQDKNHKFHDMDFGVEGQITPKVEGRVETGLTVRDYDEAPIGAVTRRTRNWTIGTSLMYKPQDRTTVYLQLHRLLQESISAGNRFYISHNAILDIKHKLPYKFSVGVNGAFGVDKYPDSQTTASGATGMRRDDIYQGGAWVEYDIQEWLSTGLSFIHRDRFSTFPADFNYTDQQTAWNLALKF